MMVVEKARAKLYGSYEKMYQNANNIKLCLQEISFAPTETYPSSGMDKDVLWERLVEATKSNKPTLGYTHNSESIQW